MTTGSDKNKIIVIVGTTASGKTGLGVRLARKFNGEIISADSRQIYRGMDVGTGKDLGEYKFRIASRESRVRDNTAKSKVKSQKSKVVKIPYHLIDVVGPKTEFSLAKWLVAARKAVDDIIARGKTPIVVGGTGLYAQALVDGFNLTSVKPDKKLRARLEKLSVKALYAKLRKLDSKFADGLHESDKKNKRRLIRYIEIKSQKPINYCHSENPPAGGDEESRREPYVHGILPRQWAGQDDRRKEFLIIGVTWPREELRKRIYKRLIERLEKEDMVGEVKRLHKAGLSWKRMVGFGLEYKYIALYLTGKLDYEVMAEQLYRAIRRFARRQMSWLRRWERKGGNIRWPRNKREANKLVSNFLKD